MIRGLMPETEATTQGPPIEDPEVAQINVERYGRLREMACKTLTVLALAASLLGASESSASAKTNKVTNEPRISNSATYWAGYQVDSPSYLDAVTDDFIVPSVSCPPSGESDVSIWVGVGTGIGSDDLYQTGVRLECTDGTESSHVWWEDYPQNSEQDYSGRTVSAGDKIVAQVLPYSGPGHNVELYVDDYGSDLSNYSSDWESHHEISLSSAPSASTSECIVERPEIDDSPADLLDFDSIDFSTATSNSPNKACDVTSNDTDHIISSSQSSLNHGLTGTKLDIVDDSDIALTSTSGPSLDGGFAVTWEASN